MSHVLPQPFKMMPRGLPVGQPVQCLKPLQINKLRGLIRHKIRRCGPCIGSVEAYP
jgi:hypothetical protein